MANIRATKNGVWSDATVWSPNAPTSTDDVFASGFTIYVDQNIQVLSINTIGTTGIGGGGTFRPNNGVVMTTNVISGSSTCVTFASASPNAFTLVGSVTAGNATSIYGINNSSTGTVNIIGNVSNGTGGSTFCIVNNSTGTVNITGYALGNRYATTGSGTGIYNVTSGVVNIYGGSFGGSLASCTGSQNASTGTITIYGTVSGYSGTNSYGAINSSSGIIRVFGNVYGGQGTSTPGLVNNSTGTVEVSGNVYGYDFSRADLNQPIGGSGSYGLRNVSTGIISVTGNVFSGNQRSDCWGIHNEVGGSVTVVGNTYGGNTTDADGARNTSTGTITISGNAIGGNGTTAYGARNVSTGILRVKRAIGNDWGLGYTTAVGAAPGVFSSAQGSQTFVEELQCGSRGQWPTAGNIYFTPNTKATAMFETDTFQNYTLIESNSADNLQPPVSSVRQGTTYNLGLSTGTCIIPSTSSVALNILVDNLSGTAVLTPTNVWNISASQITDSQSLGGRLKNTLTANAAEKIINSLNFS